MEKPPRPSPEPVLTVPFRLRGARGEVRVHYGVNEDPVLWGFDLLRLPFPVERARGFPVFLAEVGYMGGGYRALMGWSQWLTVTPHDGGPVWTGLDRAPAEEGVGVPTAFGHTPSLFDAPGPNPPRDDERWEAESWLLACPTLARSREAEPVCGVGWGYDLTPAAVRLLPARALRDADWRAARALYRGRFPDWRFGSRLHRED